MSTNIEIPTPALTVVVEEEYDKPRGSYLTTWRVKIMAGDQEIFAQTHQEDSDDYQHTNVYDRDDAVARTMEDFGSRLRDVLYKSVR